ncbi:SRPBCC family protein [Nocardioides pelophilus]|uniref:SRPBCC family protein n=1 Tax=Nocardioides pelophilus TaxID=2172019 RepID=UPI001C8269C0|nr:SRPBCC family protein [Nocardioides pelophilus]
MPHMHACQLVDLDFIDAARFRYANSVDLAITPEQLFEVLEDADSWPRWAKVITKVTWTSAPPRGVGTTRLVDMRGGLIGDEEFLLWEPPTRMAFRFNASSEKTVQAFAERYDVEPTPGGCRLTWTLALDVAGPSRFFMPVSKPVMNLTFRWFLKKLRRYTDERYGVAAAR